MNRVIKFSAWEEKTKTMLHGVSTGTVQVFSDTTGYGAKSEDCVFLQFTGLQDKNGKEIYEGDLYKDEHGMRVIEYSERMACFISTLARDRELGNPIYFENRAEIEVIGNIYESTELLK